jgi:hypothetical protein
MKFQCRLGHEHQDPDYAERCEEKYIVALEAVAKWAAEVVDHIEDHWHVEQAELELALDRLNKAKV